MTDDEWSARARSFGAVAEDYDRYRPGYPDALYDDVLALVPGRRVLEAGAGTGRASVGLASRGASVVAVEPDPDMAAVARRRTAGLAVTVEQHRFEDHRGAPGEADLVVSAQAWHWVDQAPAAAVAARALGDDCGGVLALWWNLPRELSGPAWAAVDDAYAREAPDLGFLSSAAATARTPTLERAAGFTAWDEASHGWEAHYDAATYVAMLRTHSNHIRLPEARRDRLLAAVHDAIERHGGTLTYPYRTVLVWARREP